MLSAAMAGGTVVVSAQHNLLFAVSGTIAAVLSFGNFVVSLLKKS